MPDEIPLRISSNPHQTPARAYVRTGNLPFRILNGSVGYINLLDAPNSWQLVRELRQATGLSSVASFKQSEWCRTWPATFEATTKGISP